MKRSICLILCLCMLLCLLGCSQFPAPTNTPITAATTVPETTTATQLVQTEQEQEASAVYDAPMASVALPLTVETEKNDGKTIAYYTHQDISVTLPDADVAQAVTLDLLNRIDQTRDAAETLFETARSDYSGQDSWYPYSYAITYTPMRFDQNVLSLFGTEISFNGSPRSVHNAISANYDLTTGEPLTLRGILHEENFADALCDLILNGLTTDKDTLFSDYESIIRDKFFTNVPVDSWYFSDTGLCFYFAPYEIAAYSAGTVVSEIPYELLSGLLKDTYFPAEKLTYSGTILAQTVTDTAVLDAYAQFAEVTLGDGEQKLLITTDGSVSNVYLHYATGNAESGVTDAVILTLPGMGPKDAILAELSADFPLENLSISFNSYGQAQTLKLVRNADGTLTFSK